MKYIWAPVGSRPPVLRDNHYGSAHLFGALCPVHAVGAALIMPAANSEAMSAHLQEIRPANYPRRPLSAALRWRRMASARQAAERAGRHHLLPLPPYTPELNPMENVWDYLRGNQLSHRVWDTYEAIGEACTKAWRFLINEPERIKSIAHRD